MPLFLRWGSSEKYPKNPWSQLVSPNDLTTRVAGMLTELMPKRNVNRFIGISAAGVRESIHSVNPIIRWMILNSNMRESYNDLATMESTFEKTDIDWLAVRPATFKDGEPGNQVKLTDYYGLTQSVSRGDVVKWVLDQIEQSSPFSNRTPIIRSI